MYLHAAYCMCATRSSAATQRPAAFTTAHSQPLHNVVCMCVCVCVWWRLSWPLVLQLLIKEMPRAQCGRAVVAARNPGDGAARSGLRLHWCWCVARRRRGGCPGGPSYASHPETHLGLGAWAVAPHNAVRRLLVHRRHRPNPKKRCQPRVITTSETDEPRKQSFVGAHSKTPHPPTSSPTLHPGGARESIQETRLSLYCPASL